MKKASKFLCALLAVVLTVALAVPAFASTADLGQQWQKAACDLLKVTFSNPACGAVELRGSAGTSYAIVVPDGTTMTMNPATPIIHTYWSWFEGDNGEIGVGFKGQWDWYTEGSQTTFTFKNDNIMYGFALQNEENLASGPDDEQINYAPVRWYAVMSQ